MKKVIQTLLTLSICSVIQTNAYAEDSSLSGTLTFNSNYISRGVSQTTNLPAVQGGLTYSFPHGFYANAWGSNAKFIDSPAYLEIDAMLGWAKTVFDLIDVDVNVVRYYYPGASELAYNEMTGRFTYKYLFLYLTHSENVFNLHDRGTYYSVGVNYDIPEHFTYFTDVSIKAAIGRYALGENAGNSYVDYLVALNKKINNYNISLQWTDTNGKYNYFPYDKSLWSGSVTYAF